jgi:hypothetical protein
MFAQGRCQILPSVYLKPKLREKPRLTGPVTVNRI